jgi:hypothetical protein
VKFALMAPFAETVTDLVNSAKPYGFVICSWTTLPVAGLGVIVVVMLPICVF